MQPIEPPMHWFLFTVAFLGSAATYTAAVRWFTPASEGESDLSKLAKKEIGGATAFSGLNPNGSMLEKIDLFLLRTFSLDVRLEELHMMMGRPTKPSPLDMLHLKEFFAVFFGLGAFVLTGEWPLIAFGVAGFFIPDTIFNGRIRARQLDIMRNFPTMVDLMALTIEAGLDYMSAIERILKNIRPDQRTELEKELEKMINEVQLGYSRRDALKRLAMRTGVPEIRSFVGLIIQSDELGTSLVELLRNYAADMRFRRLNKAEKLAAQAATKMLIPLFIFIFPTVFIMMLAPMLKSLVSGGLGF
jgi:tight adherence protein C